jgi:hypothetical protein
VWEMLQLQICFTEGYWDVRPCCFEVLGFAHKIDSLKVILSLPLHFVHWLVGPSRYGIDYIHHQASRIVYLQRSPRIF